MTPPALLAALRSRGVILRADAGKLYASPPNLLTPADAALVRQHKPALLQLLDAEARAAALAARWEAEDPFAGAGGPCRLVESCLVPTAAGYRAVAPREYLAALNEAEATPAGCAASAGGGSQSVRPKATGAAGTRCLPLTPARRPASNESF